MTKPSPSALPSAVELITQLHDARRRTCDLVADLTDEQLLGPRLQVVNPLLWEIGHVAWFQEKWVLQHCARQRPVLADATALYDSANVLHQTRWDLPLPSRTQTLTYLREVLERVTEWLERGEPSAEATYFVLLSLFHEDMHTEAFTYTRQTLGYPAPCFSGVTEKGIDTASPLAGALPGDVEIPGGSFWLGAMPEEPFVFDNEKWAHVVDVRPFAMGRAPVTQEEFATFVESGGYRRDELWSAPGWQWRQANDADHPVYWRTDGGNRWLRRDFDRWVTLEPQRPVLHVNWYEAEAYCRWASRRLPTEIEWEVSAAAELDSTGESITQNKRRFPWGNDSPSLQHANLDWSYKGCLDVAALPEGDSACGCRQMIGNVWEWTASNFVPYPGFIADPYQEYSVPWFHTHKVLRGGCWATRARLLRNSWRNFYLPERRDVWAGFRTCALD